MLWQLLQDKEKLNKERDIHNAELRNLARSLYSSSSP